MHRNICALPALWVGIYYDQQALDEAYDLIKDWTLEEREYLRSEASLVAVMHLIAHLTAGKTVVVAFCACAIDRTASLVSAAAWSRRSQSRH